MPPPSGQTHHLAAENRLARAPSVDAASYHTKPFPSLLILDALGFPIFLDDVPIQQSLSLKDGKYRQGVQNSCPQMSRLLLPILSPECGVKFFSEFAALVPTVCQATPPKQIEESYPDVRKCEKNEPVRRKPIQQLEFQRGAVRSGRAIRYALCTLASSSTNFCLRSVWSWPPSASAICVMFMEQNFGPHMEQNLASL